LIYPLLKIVLVDFECGTGQYLDVNSLTCQDCAAGTYSSGSSVRYDDFETLPAGFSSHVQSFKIHSDSEAINCSAWVAKTPYLLALTWIQDHEIKNVLMLHLWLVSKKKKAI